MSVFGKNKKGVEEEELVEVCGSESRYENDTNDMDNDEGYEDEEEEEECERADEDDVSRTVFMLGESYCCVDDFAMKREYESSLFWVTYRSDFSEMAPYGIRSDAGWGCMLRAAQMMLAHALRRHHKGQQWRPPLSLKQRRDDPFIRSLLTWIADAPLPQCFYSIHAMVAAGLPLNMLPGEWYGPTTAAHVLATLTKMHSNQNKHIFTTHVAPDATLYKQTVHNLMAPQHSHQQHTQQTLAHPLQINNQQQTENDAKWDKSILILIPLRLGLQSFNHTAYAKTLAHTFSIKQSLGFIGGSPRHALWFYAASADGQRLYGLDPHTVQTAPTISNKKQSIIALTDEYLRSLHCDRPTIMDMAKIDPSLSLGFYCKDKHDFDHLCTSLQNMNDHCKHQNVPILFDILQSPPDYDADVGNAMAEMCFADSHDDHDDDDNYDCNANNGGGICGDQLSDEDDYVML